MDEKLLGGKIDHIPVPITSSGTSRKRFRRGLCLVLLSVILFHLWIRASRNELTTEGYAHAKKGHKRAKFLTGKTAEKVFLFVSST